MTENLDGAAACLLAANTESACHEGHTFRYAIPSHGQYPFQWFWDSCFHAIVWSRSDPARARDELRGLLAWQEPSGFIPHVVFWDQSRIHRAPYHWNFLETRELTMLLPGGRLPRVTRHMQPPVIAQAVERVVASSSDTSFRADTLPALERYYRWLARARDPDRDGLISIIAQFESGLDYSPMYDPPVGADRRHPVGVMVRTRWPSAVNKLRYRYDLERIFRGHRHQEDVLVNAIYGQGLRALGRLALAEGKAELAAWSARQAAAVTAALLERSYDEDAGLFWNLYGPHEMRSRVRTVGSLMPLVLADMPPEVVERLIDNLTDRRHFWTRYPIPSVARSEPAFVPGIHVDGTRLIWRGPLSMNTNWFLVGGLRAHGCPELANAIAERSRELVERGGFNEFYDPLSGVPVGQPRFGWATLAADM